MSAARQEFGEVGERVAERWLRGRGWRVLQRRFRSGHRDIDLVVEREGLVAFVEVKARRGGPVGGGGGGWGASAEAKAGGGGGFGGPVEAVNWRKQRELGRSARVWIDRHGRPV